MEVVRINAAVGENAMRKGIKKGFTLLLMTAVILTAVNAVPQSAARVQAAVKPYFVVKNPTVTYKPGDNYSRYYTVLSIAGCTEKSEIKSLKSSNKKVKAVAGNGYVAVYFGDRALTSVISCKVRGTKISTKLTVKKYANPFDSFKIGKQTFTGKFNKNNEYRQEKHIERQTLSIRVKKGWKITGVSVYSGGGCKTYRVNKSTFSKKITLNGRYSAAVYVYVKNTKTGISERMIFRKSGGY